jgi:hypothetical protein
MKTLELQAYTGKLRSGNTKDAKRNVPVAKKPTTVKNMTAVTVNNKKVWFNPESRENVSVMEAVIRGACVVTMPMLAAIDWYNGTHTMYFIAPVIFYLEVSAFTLYCPIKALFSNYNQPVKYE